MSSQLILRSPAGVDIARAVGYIAGAVGYIAASSALPEPMALPGLART